MSTFGPSETWPGQPPRPREPEPRTSPARGSRRQSFPRWLGLLLLLLLLLLGFLLPWLLSGPSGVFTNSSTGGPATGWRSVAVGFDGLRWDRVSVVGAFAAPVVLGAVFLLLGGRQLLVGPEGVGGIHTTSRLSVEERSRRSYFQGLPHPLRPLPLTLAVADRPEHWEDDATTFARSRLIQLRGEVLARRHHHLFWLGAYNDADGDRLAAWKAEGLHRAGMSYRAEELQLVDASLREARLVGKAAATTLEDVGSRLLPLEAALVERLLIAHRLLTRSSAWRRRPELWPTVHEMGALLELGAAYEQGFPLLRALRREVAVKRALTVMMHRGAAGADGADRLLATRSAIHHCLVELHERWQGDPSSIVPRNRAAERRAASLGQYLVPHLPGPTETEELFAAADLALGRGFHVGHRLLGRLGRLAELAETMVGLEPLRSDS